MCESQEPLVLALRRLWAEAEQRKCGVLFLPGESGRKTSLVREDPRDDRRQSGPVPLAPDFRWGSGMQAADLPQPLPSVSA